MSASAGERDGNAGGGLTFVVGGGRLLVVVLCACGFENKWRINAL